MIISTMQLPGQGRSWYSVSSILQRHLDFQRPLRADWMKTATTWQFAFGAEKYHVKSKEVSK